MWDSDFAWGQLTTPERLPLSPTVPPSGLLSPLFVLEPKLPWAISSSSALQIPMATGTSAAMNWMTCSRLPACLCLGTGWEKLQKTWWPQVTWTRMGRSALMSLSRWVWCRSQGDAFEMWKFNLRNSSNTFPSFVLQRCLFFPFWFPTSQIRFLKIHYVFAGFSWPEKHRGCQDL